MMNAFEVKNWQELLLLIVMTLVTLAVLIGLPNALTWVTWNAILGDVFKGPYIDFIQALPLTLAFFIVCGLILKPELKLEIHQSKSPEEMEKAKKRFEAKHKDPSLKP